MEVVTAVLGGDRDVAELWEFSIVVELRDLEFADEFGVTKNSLSIGLVSCFDESRKLGCARDY